MREAADRMGGVGAVGQGGGGVALRGPAPRRGDRRPAGAEADRRGERRGSENETDPLSECHVSSLLSGMLSRRGTNLERGLLNSGS